MPRRNAKSQVCGSCKRKFSTTSALSRHKREAHPVSESRPTGHRAPSVNTEHYDTPETIRVPERPARSTPYHRPN